MSKKEKLSLEDLAERIEQLKQKSESKSDVVFNGGLVIGFKYGLLYAQNYLLDLTKKSSTMTDKEIRDTVNNVIKEVKEKKQNKKLSENDISK